MTGHAHRGGYAKTLRRFTGHPGMWVNVHGEWCRPMHVWIYRGMWRVLCRVCFGPLTSDDALNDHGWFTQHEAMTVARRHCVTCPLERTP